MKSKRFQYIVWLCLSYLSIGNLLALETGLSIYEGRLTEKNSIEFLVNMSAKPNIPIEFTYTTVDGSAKAGFDYIKSVGKVIIQPGEKKAFINVPLIYNTKKIKKPTNFYVVIASQNTAVFIQKAVGVIEPEKLSSNFSFSESNISKGGIK